MDGQSDEPAGGSKRRRGAGVSVVSPHSSTCTAESAPSNKSSGRSRKSRTSGDTSSSSLRKSEERSLDLSQPTPAKVIKVSFAGEEDLGVAKESPNPTSTSSKGKGKSKGKPRSLRPRKTQSYADSSTSLESLEVPAVSVSRGKGKKLKLKESTSAASCTIKVSVEPEDLAPRGKKSKTTKSKSSKQSKKEKTTARKSSAFDHLDQHLQLYSDSDDLVEELEDLLSSAKKRCLRSTSTDEREATSPFNACLAPGPSSSSKRSEGVSLGSSSSKKTEDSKSPSGKKGQHSKSGSKGKGEKKLKGEETLSTVTSTSSSVAGKSKSRKTGSCASNSGRHSSTGSRGSGRAGTSRGSSSVSARERSEGNKGSGTNLTGVSSMSSANQQSAQEGSASPGSGGGSGGGARPRDGAQGVGQPEGQGSGSLLGAIGGTGPDNDGDESDMNRLQALLEARGLPSQLFGALGPRMHQLLHRTMSGGTLSKVQHLLQSLQATGDEAQQLSALMEMCQILVMGNEDSLVGFPIKLVVPALIQLLQMEHNFEMMIHASRALTYMMEALPRSSASVVEGVSVFLEKLQVINCIDVAEQSLSALETLSKRHGKAILQAGGISACLMFLDFFSIIAQRRALNITANCVQSMSSDEFHYMRDSLSLLSGRLSHSDNKSVESVCLCFARLVDNFQSDQRLLKEIAVHDLLTNIQQLLVMSPPVISTSTFVTVVRMLVVMCSNCPDLAVILLKQKIAETLRYLLTGSSVSHDQEFELIQRTPQELYEIVSLIGELLPRLPTDGLFSVNLLLRKGGMVCQDSAFWQWQDDRGLWHMYTPIDNKIVEAAYQTGEEEVSLSTMGRSYLLDFNSMQQINEDTGTARPVVRKSNNMASLTSSSSITAQSAAIASQTTQAMDPNVERCDSRAEILKEDQELATNFIQTLFAVLYEVYSSSAGPNIRHKCLQTILRMIYYSSPDLLRSVLCNQPVSSHIAGMLGAPDLKVIVGAVQMANILMQKLPEVFSIYFRREGVTHQVQRLANQEVTPDSPTKSSPSPTSGVNTATPSSQVLGSSASDPTCSIPTRSLARTDVSEPPHPHHHHHHHPEGEELFATSGVSPPLEEPCASSAQMKLSDVLKRKRPPRRGPSKKGNKSEDGVLPETPPKGVGLLLGRNSGRGKAASSKDKGKEARSSSSSSKIPFLTNLNPRTWGRMGASAERQATMKEMLAHKHMPQPSVVNKEKVREWIKAQCKALMEKYFSADMNGGNHPALDTLKRLCAASKCLSLQGDNGHDCLLELSSIMCDSDISPFEVIHSGLISQLLAYLTSVSGDVCRDVRIRRFLHVFLNCPVPSVTLIKEPLTMDVNKPAALSSLVSKLMACLHQLEQFQVKVHDLPGGSGGSSRGGNALKFFTTHQLKCQLQRHPACTTVKQWKGGPVKIDPLALVQAIEKYLLVRGFGKTREGVDEDLSDEDNSDEEMEEQMASIMISASSARHRLEFLIGDTVLPYNMTVYQAVKQYVCHGGSEVGDFSDGDADSPFGNTSLWVQTHTIWYRPATEREENTANSPKKTKAESKSVKTSKKKESRVSSPVSQPILHSFLSEKMPPSVTVQDASLETIALLRVLHALNRHWSSMYDISFVPSPVLPITDYISSKLTAKTNRQLQDPLIIMTGNLPSWLPEIGQAAPFLLPFDTRQMLFFATTFDRDRAVLRLQQDQAGESSSHDSERVGPRLDRKRREVSRKDILKQAEKVMEDMSTPANGRTMLEIHYENEVGTGLGPTLEFYALVSKELQRHDLDLWRGESVTSTSPADPNVKQSYVSSPCGLFPVPLPRGCKAAHVNKVKAKFKFLGKFMAKALMDSRMIDLPLSRVFYKWILGMETSLTSSDLYHVDPVLARSFQSLERLAFNKKQILYDNFLTEEGRQQALANLTLDGCSVDDLDLYFMLPGSANLELCKGGADMRLTLDNIEEYLQLVLHWTLVEGVNRQFEAFRDGFESLFPLSTLLCFYPEELEQLFCGNSSESWDVRMLTDCCRPDHGYNHDSQAVKFLFQVLSSYDTNEQRDFLQFVTGSPRLPVGGFRSLNPALTIVRKQPEGVDNPDNYLPSVMTCVNYLKLPDYSCAQVMRAKLQTAAKEGQLSFHLS